MSAVLASAIALSATGCGSTSSQALLSTSRRSTSSIGAIEKIVASVNDHPRNANAPNFAPRRAAAHRAGRWLTDELNRHDGAVIRTNRRKTLSNPNCGQESGCGPVGGGGGGSTPTWSTFSDTAPYDTELDFGDGTSLLTLELGEDLIGTLEIDGSVTAYHFDPNNQIDSTRFWYCMAEYGVPNCYLPPKSFCPYIALTYGAIARLLAIAAIKEPASSTVIGGFVGLAVKDFCDSLYAYESWPDSKLRIATTFNSRRS
ncbi:MAG TPA: hypothetical protein VGC72_19270 [Candidatus Elarobacter sp.]